MEKMEAKIDNKQFSLFERFQMGFEINKNEITKIKDQMKDTNRSLEVMQNIVKQNTVLLEKKVKKPRSQSMKI